MNASSTRQLALLTLLAGAKKALNQAQVCERLPNFYQPEKSKKASITKMFERDLAALSAAGAPIVAEEAEESGEDMVYRVLSGKALVASDFALDQEATDLLRQLLADPLVQGQLPDTAQRLLSNLLCFHAPFDTDAKGERKEQGQTEGRVQKLAAAASDSQALSIEYPVHGHGKSQMRDVSPAGVYFYRGQAYMVGMCHRSEKPQTFLVSKIKRIQVCKNAYLDAPQDFSLQSHAYRNVYLLQAGDIRQVTLKVAAPAVWRLEGEAPFAIVERKKDGSVIAKINVTESKFFYRQVLAFGPHAEILDPPEFRQGLLDYLGASS